MKKILSLLAFLVCVLQANFDDGLKAYEDGNYAKAAQIFERLCKDGDTQACFNIGHLYANGSGVKQNFTRSSKYFKIACDAGNYQGCYALGIAYANGDGVQKDAQKSRQMLEAACDMNGDICVEIAHTDYGASKWLDALKFYKFACEKGSSEGCFGAGGMYERGEGTRKDLPTALKFYDKACRAGDGKACFNIGTIYYNDEVIKKDDKTALGYFKKACELGEEAGCDIKAGLEPFWRKIFR